MRGHVGLAAALGLVVACTRSVADNGSTCELNTDCRAPLVCAAGLCRPQCRGDRDCAAGESCHGVGETAVCVPSGMAVPCAFSSQCGDGQHCVGGTCRTGCTTDADCAGAGACVTGVCSLPVIATGSDGGALDATSGDARPSCAGVRCGARCVDTMTDPEHCGACEIACATGTTCVGGACVGCDPLMTTCRPTYDDCDTPLVIEAVMPSVTVGVPTAGLTASLPSCGTGSDYYIETHSADRAIVGVDVHCAPGEVQLAPVASCADSFVTCRNCLTSEVLEAAVLDGSSARYLVECDQLDSTVSVTRFPLTPLTDVERIVPTAVLDADPVLPASGGMGLCGAAGGSHVWYFDECSQSYAGDVSTCGSTLDVSVAYVDNTGGIHCGDADTACAGAGQHVHAVIGVGVSAIVVSAVAPGGTTGVHVHGAFF